jgi:hypothetical protein
MGMPVFVLMNFMVGNILHNIHYTKLCFDWKEASQKTENKAR